MKITTGKTELNLSFSFTALLTVMLLLCDEGVVLMCLLSSLFHEGGHLFFMYTFGDVPEKISLGAFGMRIDRRSLLPYKKEAVVALGGIIFNFALCALSVVWYLLSSSRYALEVFAVNCFVALINSFPIGVLDMGRAVECLLLSRLPAERVCALTYRISLVSVTLFALAFIVYTLVFGFNFSFAAVTVYLFAITIIKKWS